MFRDAVDDSMRDMPVRVLGRVTDIEPSGTTRRARIEIRVATPQDHLELLGRYLRRQR